MRRWPALAVLAVAVLAGCTASPEPEVSPSATASASASASASPAASPDDSASPSATATAADGCPAFDTTGASASSDDWSGDLSADLWGVTMRVGTHECYDRWVMEFKGKGAMPGWSVTPHAASVFTVDGSGDDLSPALTGNASLEVSFGAWYDGTVLEKAPYEGPKTVMTGGFVAIQEARIVGAFEGITQVGIGLDSLRPYRVMWLEGPPRLVVDVAK
ncbi:AMIN-like domain-containing (lipo)protein [Demequina maris]|uniref:AMIN-like domain-containing (lipo)protein n=1 Tax=Demequina maris TaxID=1638982 RepID=UPI000A8897CA